MKNIMKIFVLFFLAFTATTNLSAQEPVKKIETAEFTVAGVCNMCKTRIENAALTKGVKTAEWDKDAQLLKVIYSTKKTDVETIQKAVAAAGHDAGDVKATDEAYGKLPDCCAYRDGVEVH